MDFAQDLSALRKARGIPLRSLAPITGVSIGTISKFCNGKLWPRQDFVQRYIKACGVSDPEVSEWIERWRALTALIRPGFDETPVVATAIQLSAEGVVFNLRLDPDAPAANLYTKTEVSGRQVEVTVSIGPVATPLSP